jgi:hypothetical protein
MRRLIVAGALAAAVTIGGIPWTPPVAAAGPGTCLTGHHPVATGFHHGALTVVDVNGNGFVCIRSLRFGSFSVRDDVV